MVIPRSLQNILMWRRDSKRTPDRIEKVLREEKTIKPVTPEYVASIEERLIFVGSLLNTCGGRIGGGVSLGLNIRALELERNAMAHHLKMSAEDTLERYGLPPNTPFINGFYRQHDSIIIDVFENNLKGLVDLFSQNGFGFYSRKALINIPMTSTKRLSYDIVTPEDAVLINEDGSYKHRNLALLHQQTEKGEEVKELIHKIEVYVHHPVYLANGKDYLLMRDYGGKSPSGFITASSKSPNIPGTDTPMESVNIRIIGHEKDRQQIPVDYYLGKEVNIDGTIIRTIHPYVRLLTFANMEFPPIFTRHREIRGGEVKYSIKPEWPDKQKRTLDVTSQLDKQVIDALASIMHFEAQIVHGAPKF